MITPAATRRSVAKGAAWAAPALTVVAVAAPVAASGCATPTGSQGSFTTLQGTTATGTGGANWRKPVSSPFTGTTSAAVVDNDNGTVSSSTTNYLIQQTTYTFTGATAGTTYTFTYSVHGRYGNNCYPVGYSQSAVVKVNGVQDGYFQTRTPTVTMPSGAATGSATTLASSSSTTSCGSGTSWGAATTRTVTIVAPANGTITFQMTYYVQPRVCGTYSGSRTCAGTAITPSDDIAITQPAFVSCG